MVAVWNRGGSAGKGLRPLLSDRDGYQRAGVTLSADIIPEYEEGLNITEITFSPEGTR